MFAKGNGWAAVDGLPPVRLQAGDVVLFPQGDRHVVSSAPGLTPGERRPELLLARGGQLPVPISFHEGIVDAGPMPIESADAVVVCGLLGGSISITEKPRQTQRELTRRPGPEVLARTLKCRLEALVAEWLQ